MHSGRIRESYSPRDGFPRLIRISGKRRHVSKGRRGKRVRSTHANLHASVSVLGEDELFEQLASVEDPFLLILDQVQDPRNYGACLRSADAAGVDFVVVPGDRAASVTEVVRKVASGAAESLRIARVGNLSNCLLRLKEEALIRLVGTSDRSEKTLFQVDFKGSVGLVMGAEGSGIRRLTADRCDELVSIPMSGSVDCLNVSVAAGVCLFEAVRQRTA
ncbi:MAG: 23S rRNA (guanosine(2251)-2'-O)-methyltransferase RlmB [Opitutae bacterium]|nr:23S rRNA (guanosine(2251)-2'-O)-methyltransferase RlmB [Opitutae bacterium]